MPWPIKSTWTSRTPAVVLIPQRSAVTGSDSLVWRTGVGWPVGPCRSPAKLAKGLLCTVSCHCPRARGMTADMRTSMQKPRVLIADDHAMVAEGLSLLLRDDFELVGSARDGSELFELAKQTK